jgi:hypothetical protein
MARAGKVCPGRVFGKYEMVRLEAVCLGYAVPRGRFEAEVHSVFTSAANLRLVRSDLLLTMVTVEQADLPQGIRLHSPQGFSFEGQRTGEKFTCRDGILCCEQASLIIDLRPAKRWKCDLSSLAADMNVPSTSAAWLTVRRMLDERQGRAATGYPAGQVAVVRKMDESVSNLVAATFQNDSSATNVVATLIGLGPGLTPGGDDFLVGYLAGLRCAAGDMPERMRFLSGLGEAVIRLSRQTNDISRTYLVHAARGQVSSRLENLARAICQGERSDHLLETAVAALHVGHTSGMEAVSGLLLGLSAWNEDPAGGR